jgi:hypothetical protein
MTSGNQSGKRQSTQRLSNAQLVGSDIPEVQDWQRFAATFDGYRAMGGPDACAELANNGSPRTLTELRACLFFEGRRTHFGVLPDEAKVKRIAELLSQIAGKVRRGEVD